MGDMKLGFLVSSSYSIWNGTRAWGDGPVLVGLTGSLMTHGLAAKAW
jgi:hypothetical protein